MKISTFNVNGINGRLPRLLDWLAETAPDIVCLQELRTADASFPYQALEENGYRGIWHGQRAHHGVAILAKGMVPTETRRGLPGEETDMQTRYIEATVEDAVVASVYLPNGNPVPSLNFDYKLRWFDRFIDHLSGLYALPKPAVVAGDLNVVATDFDIYSPDWWRTDAVMQPETREAYRRLLDQGWIDAIRVLHPRERMYTYWTTEAAYRNARGFRLDYFLLNGAAGRLLESAGVDSQHRGRDRASDHAPVWLKLKRGP